MDDMGKISAAKHPPTSSAITMMGQGGMMQSGKIWMGSATTTGGAWSIDYTAARFAQAPKVFPIVELSDTDVFDRGLASLSSAPTATGASGYAIRGANLLVLGATVRTVPDGTSIHVVAIGA